MEARFQIIMTHTASASFFHVGTAVAASAATMNANTIMPIEGAIIQLPISIYSEEEPNKAVHPTPTRVTLPAGRSAPGRKRATGKRG